MGMKRKVVIAIFIAFILSLDVTTVFAIDTVVAEVHNPTCTEVGYIEYRNRIDGSVSIGDELPALGHQYDENGICTVCGEAKDYNLPSIRFVGQTDGISKSNIVTLRVEFCDGEHDFNGYAGVTYQGHSSMLLPKKNFTVRLFEDENLVNKHRMIFGSFQLEHKYILKANYTDPTSCKNLLCARLWGDMAAMRKDVPERLANTSNYGAVDGFPVTVWFNGEFYGLYSMNLHKDNDLFGMKVYDNSAIMICNEQINNESLFRSEAAFIDDVSDWELEYSANSEKEWAIDSFNSMLKFVAESTGPDFVSGASNYIDVSSAVDYLIFMYVMGLENSYAKNLIMITYDGSPWLATVYDMDEAFLASNDFFPIKNDEGVWSSGTGSRLWDLLLESFPEEIAERYAELREGALSQENIQKRVDQFKYVPDELIELELQTWPGRTPRTLSDMQTYLLERLNYADTVFGGMKQ